MQFTTPDFSFYFTFFIFYWKPHKNEREYLYVIVEKKIWGRKIVVCISSLISQKKKKLTRGVFAYEGERVRINIAIAQGTEEEEESVQSFFHHKKT